MPRHTVDVPASTVAVPGHTVAVPGSTVAVPGPTVDVPRPTVAVPGHTVAVSTPTIIVSDPPVTVPAPQGVVHEPPVDGRKSNVNTGRQVPQQPVFRLVGADNLLVKAVTFRSAKSHIPETLWPVVVPRTLVHAVLSVFHGDTSIFGHGGKHKT